MKKASGSVNRALKKESSCGKQKGEKTQGSFPAKEGSTTNRGRGDGKVSGWGRAKQFDVSNTQRVRKD